MFKYAKKIYIHIKITKKNKDYLPYIGSHISLKHVFFVSFVPILIFTCGYQKHVVVNRFVV